MEVIAMIILQVACIHDLKIHVVIVMPSQLLDIYKNIATISKYL